MIYTSYGTDLLATDRFDRVFWLGDLNYRVRSTRAMADAVIKDGLLEV